MCGIAGFYDLTQQANEHNLQQITEVLHHRGPDDTGYFFEKESTFHIGLGHKRLSILDISACGHQPMHFEQLSVVFNGEIYNFQDIKDELVKQGYSFSSSSDTEVALKAFHKWGMQAISKFNGMFAIALYDQTTEDLFLIRDRVGVKPLFYHCDREKLVFGSELKSIMAYAMFEKEIDKNALYTYLYHGYIASPQSIFKNVYKVLPGKYIKFNKGNLEVVTYWDLKQKFTSRKKNLITSESEALQGLKDCVKKAVSYRMIADVPVGAFLSGGYDSSLIAAMMQEQSSHPIKTFTIGFHESAYNEAPYAYEIANHLKTDHYEKYLHIDDALDLVEKIPLYFDEPFADSSQLPTMMVSQIAKEEVTVALSGDGGDELFCGYERYDEVMQYWRYRKIFTSFEWLNRRFKVGKLLNLVDLKYKKLLHLHSLQNIINHRYILSQYYMEGLVKDCPFVVDDDYFQMLSLSSHPQEAFMLQDMLMYLPDDIMVKVDRATMSASLEGREPLLDYNLFEYSFSLSHDLKYKNGEKKYLLKKLAHQYMPKSLLERPKKGFSLPIHIWLKEDLNSLIQVYLSEDYIVEQNIFNYLVIENILRKFNTEKGHGKYTSLIWNLIVFQLWYQKYFVL